MGLCGTKTQRELPSDIPIIPPISEYQSSFHETPLKSKVTSIDSFSSNPEQSNDTFLEQKQTETNDTEQQNDNNNNNNKHLFKFKDYERTLLRQKFNDYNNCSILSCRSIKRIVLLFKYYKFLQINYPNCNEYNNKLLQYLNTKYLYLINDYH
eukprot:329173_1